MPRSVLALSLLLLAGALAACGGDEHPTLSTAAGTGRIEFGLDGPGADEPERTAAFDVTVS